MNEQKPEVIFDDLYNLYFDALHKWFQKRLNSDPELVEHEHIKAYNSEVGYRKDYKIYQIKIPDDPKVTAYNLGLNVFKKDILDYFQFAFSKYNANPISNFLKRDLPELKKIHIESHKEGLRLENYAWDPDFMYKASDYQILKLCAKNFAYEKLIHFLRERQFNSWYWFGEKPVHDFVDEELKSDKVGTNAQQVMAILLLEKIYKIKTHQDTRRLVNFIHFLTGKDWGNIHKFVSAYLNSDGIVHKGKSRNLDDYKIVKTLFEGLENQEVISKIDSITNRIKQLNDK